MVVSSDASLVFAFCVSTDADCDADFCPHPPSTVAAIANDNKQESKNHGQVGIDTLMEGKCQVGRYFNIRYTDLIDMLIEAENKGYIALNNNFGNRLIEFNDTNYDALIEKYFVE